MPADDPIAAYVTELRPRLSGSWLRRRRIIAEVRGHLADAVASDPVADQDPAAAARRAIDRFGTVDETAQAFASEGEQRGRSGRTRLGIAVAAAVLVCAAVVATVLALNSGQDASQSSSLNARRDQRFHEEFHKAGQLRKAAVLCPIDAQAFVAATAAARYLGLTNAQLHAQLEADKSLTQIATERHASVDGLRSTVQDAVRGELRVRVDAGPKRIRRASERANLRRVAKQSRHEVDNEVDRIISRPHLGVPRCAGAIIA